MCTKSKTSFGCGHYVKKTVPCDSLACTEMDTWKFPVDKDCSECKRAGAMNSRGREGRGIYAKEIRTREHRRTSPARTSSSGHSFTSATPNLSISPWAANKQSAGLKTWDSPTRQVADTAWLKEHDSRMSDLEECTSKMMLGKRRDSTISSPRNSYERIIEADEVEEPEELDYVTIQPKPLKFLLPKSSQTSEMSPLHYRIPRYSQSSGQDATLNNQLVPSVPRRKTLNSVPVSEYPETPSYKQTIRRSRKTKTEPYYAQSCSFDPPVTILSNSGPLPSELWMSPYQYVPSFQQEAYYSRTYPVY